MCQRHGIKAGFYSHILLSPRGHTESQISASIFPPTGIYTELQKFESSFSTNYLNIFLPNNEGEKNLSPLLAALECPPVIALSSHTGLSIPVQSSLKV